MTNRFWWYICDSYHLILYSLDISPYSYIHSPQPLSPNTNTHTHTQALFLTMIVKNAYNQELLLNKKIRSF